MQSQCGVSQFGGGNAWYPNIDGHSLHVQAVPSDPMPMCSKVFIGVRRSIATHHLNLPIAMTDRSDYVMQQIKDLWIIFVDRSCSIIAQILIDSRQGPRVVLVSVAVHNIEMFPRVDVVEVKLVGGVIKQIVRRTSCHSTAQAKQNQNKTSQTTTEHSSPLADTKTV
jgi:hypothetical protein